MGGKKMKEVFDKCYFCHAPLRPKISDTVTHTFEDQKIKYTVKHEPSLACTKCNNSFQAESYQYEKTAAFMNFLKSIGLKTAEIEYRDMIEYVDNVLKFKGDE
jgi:uncharacterized protein with PIN domain